MRQQSEMASGGDLEDDIYSGGAGFTHTGGPGFTHTGGAGFTERRMAI